MRLGGVETSLLGLLQSFDYSSYEVDLFLHLHDGEFLEHIPNEVNLIKEHKSYASLLLPQKKAKISILIMKFLAKLYSSIYGFTKQIKGQNFVYLLTMHRFTHYILPDISSKTYDLGISFLTPHYTVAHKVKATKKAAWIHTDYSVYELDKKEELKMWTHFDYIASISELSSKAFLAKFEELKDKVCVIENILPKTFVETKCNEFEVNYNAVHNQNPVYLCSIGRLCYAKNFDNIPEITRLLIENGIDVFWNIIGYGNDEDLIRSRIKEFGMEHHVKLLGKQPNPYPYIKACDIYVQPSRFEGKAVTVREAQMLYKPVVITNFSSSQSQLIDGFDGIIVPLDNTGCANGIKEVITNQSLQQQLTYNCKMTDYSNTTEIEKIYSLMD